VLVAGDRLHADAVEIVDGCPKTDRVSDIPGARLEARRSALVNGLLESHIGDHAAAALPGRRRIEDRLLAVQRADACGCEHLVPGQHKEVSVEGLNVRSLVGDRLRAVDQGE
jgi:hypothetical protein